MKARAGGEKGRHLCIRLVQKIAEGETSYALSWKANVMIKKQERDDVTRHRKQKNQKDEASVGFHRQGGRHIISLFRSTSMDVSTNLHERFHGS